MWNKKLKARMAAAATTAALTVSLMGMTAFAATGIVNTTDVNVRSTAGTSGDIVGTATVGETYDLGESSTDADGNTWYQITLSDGTTGYIRSDFLDISDDTSADGSSTESTDAATTESTDTATTDTSSTDTGDYQIVLAPDDSGQNTYYLYNNAEGVRMKLSDIDTMRTELTTAQEQASSIRTKYRIFLIVLGVLFIIALIGCIMLYMRLREALSAPQQRNRERDLTRDRNNERRNNPHSDDLNLRSTRADRESGAPQRPVNGAQRRPVNGQPVRRPVNGQGQPVRRPMQGQAPQGQPVRRPVQGQGMTSRPVQGQAPQGQGVRRPVQGQAPQGAAQRPVRPVSGEQQVQRPSAPQDTVRRPMPQQQAQRPQARPAAPADDMDDDDEFDSNFINLDDKE